MNMRTLVTHRLYFGMDALALRGAMTRVLARVAGLPPERAWLNTRNLRHDFELDTVQGRALVDSLVNEGLLEPRPEREDDYLLTERFLEFATARVVEPLPRIRAKRLVRKACLLASRINAEWKRNPLEVELIAPFGAYMSCEQELAELSLGIVLRPRDPSRRARWGRIATSQEGADDICAAVEDLSTFIVVRLVNEAQLLPRPFAVAFHTELGIAPPR